MVVVAEFVRRNLAFDEVPVFRLNPFLCLVFSPSPTPPSTARYSGAGSGCKSSNYLIEY